MAIFSETPLKDDLITRGKLSYYVAIISMIIMPVYHWFLPPFIILWFIFWLFDIRLLLNNQQNIPHNYKILFILSILFYVWQIIGMVYSDNHEAGWRNIVLRLPLFVFPIVLISPREMIRQKVNSLLQFFSLATFTSIIICFGYALYRSININNGEWSFNPHPPVEDWLNYFFASEFAIFQHPSYLSLYAIFSMYIAAESFFNGSVTMIRRILWLLVGVCLLISIYLLSSRAGILAAIISLPVYFLYKFRIRSAKKTGILIFIIIIIIPFVLLPVFKSNPRFSYYFNDESKNVINNTLLKESRLAIWKSSFNIVRNNFILGVGTGDIQDELNKEYKLAGDKDLEIGNNLNAHNQFLEVLLENGFIGLLLFLSLFGMMFYISVKEGNLLYLVFIIIVFVSFMFETMLNRLAGISFYALFSFLLLYNKRTIQL